MKQNVPHSPFATRLSGSAREVELRIRNIVQGPKKRPPLWLMVLIILAILSCGGLVSCQPQEPPQAKPAGPLTRYPLEDLGEGSPSLLLSGREFLIRAVPTDGFAITGKASALQLLCRDPATGAELWNQSYNLANADWEGTGLFPFSDVMGYNGFLLRYRQDDVHTVYHFCLPTEYGFSYLFEFQDDLWLGDLDGDGRDELLASRPDYGDLILYHQSDTGELWSYTDYQLAPAVRSLLNLSENVQCKVILQTDGIPVVQLPDGSADIPIDPAVLLARVLELKSAPHDALTLRELNLDGLGDRDDTLDITCYNRSEFHPSGLVTARVHLGTGAELYWEYPSSNWLKDVYTIPLISPDRQTVVLELPYAYANWEGADYFLLEVRYGLLREVGCMTGDTEGLLGSRSLSGSARSVMGLEVVDRTDSPLKALRVPTFVDRFEDYIWYTLTWDEAAEQFRCEPTP